MYVSLHIYVSNRASENVEYRVALVVTTGLYKGSSLKGRGT